MSVEENKVLVRREQGELWNHTGNLDAAAELFAPDRVEDAKQEAASVRRGFPDLELAPIGSEFSARRTRMLDHAGSSRSYPYRRSLARARTQTIHHRAHLGTVRSPLAREESRPSPWLPPASHPRSRGLL